MKLCRGVAGEWRLQVQCDRLRRRRSGLRCDDEAAADPQIAAALQQVSAQRIQANIEKLVSFGTRSTLSAQDPASIAAGHGIGAAREWIKSEFERYSKDCGGCLEVKTDSFTETRRPNSEGNGNHQCLCGLERIRCGERKTHRAGDGALRFAQQRHARCRGRRSGGERRWQRDGRQPGVRARVEQVKVPGNHYFSYGGGRRAGAKWQQHFRKRWRRIRAGIWKRC